MILIEPIRNGKYIKDGAYALAIQVWALHNLKVKNKTIIFPFICDPHIQLGYFQNPEVEVNKEYLDKNNIPVVRRDTGGGAIFIDSNSVNFCFLIPLNSNTNSIYANYQEFYKPIIKVLKDMGIKNIMQSGKNDLTINGKKVSGAAMLKEENIIYGGYSLLYDIDLDAMILALKPSRKKIESKGIKSINQRVDKLKNHLNEQFKKLTIFEFKDEIIKRLMNVEKIADVERYVLSNEQWLEIDKLVDQKYKNWEWVYGLSPRYQYNCEARLEIGTMNISLIIDNGKIKSCKISGDFFATKDLTIFEKSLEGTKMIKQDLKIKLQELDISSYFFKKIDNDQLLELILS
ncbi:lipoate--protein ligase [Spiroplasma endosymbiont of Panzeria rudis]|uniref:lipoate--protein ligase n=1 Tax=Spiroplasma endosymbiont of Panzeria rudis TaxID=3066301 RepID=UPI0030CA9F25